MISGETVSGRFSKTNHPTGSLAWTNVCNFVPFSQSTSQRALLRKRCTEETFPIFNGNSKAAPGILDGAGKAL